jgi:hypothetical protein
MIVVLRDEVGADRRVCVLLEATRGEGELTPRRSESYVSVSNWILLWRTYL